MNRTLKEATEKSFTTKNTTNLKNTFNVLSMPIYLWRKIKGSEGLTLFDYINKCWNEQRDKSRTNTEHRFAGLRIFELGDVRCNSYTLKWCRRRRAKTRNVSSKVKKFIANLEKLHHNSIYVFQNWSRK